MVVQLFIAFVEAVYRKVKSFGVGDVDGHRQIEPRAGFPHGIETAVVHRNQASGW
jgi:hypothetical protein